MSFREHRLNFICINLNLQRDFRHFRRGTMSLLFSMIIIYLKRTNFREDKLNPREIQVFFFSLKFSFILGSFDFCLITYLVCFAKINPRKIFGKANLKFEIRENKYSRNAIFLSS